jgi:hypothetical protein
VPRTSRKDARMADTPKPWWRHGRRWGNWGAAVVLVGMFPLIPLVFGFGFTHEITADSLMLTAALDGLAVALTSRNPFLFAVFLLFTIAAAGFYGHAVPSGPHPGQVFGTVAGLRLSATSNDNLALGVVFFWALIPPFVTVVGQRFLLHMRLGERFFLFV